MKIWRVAHKTSREGGFPAGPYQGADIYPEQRESIEAMYEAHTDAQHPSPDADPLLRSILGFERCGFDSREALNAWFDEWLTPLADAGFEVWTYEVPDFAVRVGQHGQVVFVADEARELSHEPFRFEQAELPV